MELRETITLIALLTYLGLNYKGVTEAIIEAASNDKTEPEFIDNFHKYYDELDLGGDDKWMDCRMFLSIVLRVNRL